MTTRTKSHKLGDRLKQLLDACLLVKIYFVKDSAAASETATSVRSAVKYPRVVNAHVNQCKPDPIPLYPHPFLYLPD